MKNVQLMDCSQPAAIKLERVNFFNRQLLTADDMTTERDYFLQKLRRHNRFMHGWGVVCGLNVTAAPVAGKAWQVQIGSGYALGPYGDEIFVGEAAYFDLAACLTGGPTNPCEPSLLLPGAAGSGGTFWLAIKYAECLASPVQVASSGCGCDNDPCQYSRIRDSFQIQCLGQLPPQPGPPPTLCQIVGGTLAPCPPCPTDPWVVLAKINLPSSSTSTMITIDNSVRRLILSSAILQDQIVQCCCGQTPPPPPPTVHLQAIQVSSLQQPTNWVTSLSLGNSGNQPFNFRLVLTGPAPTGGLQVNVSQSSPFLVTISNPNPFVAAGVTTTPAFTGNSVSLSATAAQSGDIPLVAKDTFGNSATATLVIPPPIK